MPPLRKPAPGRRLRRTRAVELPADPPPVDPPPVDPPSPAAGESNPWETAAVRVAYRDGFILCAPGTDPAPLIEALDPRRRISSPHGSTRIIADVIARAGGVHGVIAWLARTALREERVVATC